MLKKRSRPARTTSATSIEGVLCKLRVLLRDVQIGTTEWSEGTAESAIADLERLAGEVSS